MVYCGVSGTVSNGSCSVDKSYSKGDFKEIAVDGIGVGGAAFVGWVDLIVLLIVLGFIVGIFMKLGNLFK